MGTCKMISNLKCVAVVPWVSQLTSLLSVPLPGKQGQFNLEQTEVQGCLYS